MTSYHHTKSFEHDYWQWDLHICVVHPRVLGVLCYVVKNLVKHNKCVMNSLNKNMYLKIEYSMSLNS